MLCLRVVLLVMSALCAQGLVVPTKDKCPTQGTWATSRQRLTTNIKTDMVCVKLIEITE